MPQGVSSGYSGSNPPATGSYIPALDGLRAVAILLVVASHAGLDRVVPGAFGVTLFFFISGYLITRQLLGNLSVSGRIGLGGFYLRRVLRLLPAGLVYTVAAGTVFSLAGGIIRPLGWTAALLYGASVYDLWIGYRSTLAGVRHPFNILWSLAIEEHFYAVWPVALAAIWRLRSALIVVAVLCAAVLAWRLWLFDRCGNDVWSVLCGRVQPPQWRYNRLYLGTDTRFDSIAWGALLALAEHRKQAWAGTAARSRLLQAAAFALLIAGFLMPGGFARQVLRTTLQGVALLLLFPAMLGQDHALRRLLSAAPAVLIGRLSYSLYLWHWGAFALADAVATPYSAAWLAIGLPLSALLATASYWLVEQPMLRWRRRAGSHTPLGLIPQAAPVMPVRWAARRSALPRSKSVR